VRVLILRPFVSGNPDTLEKGAVVNIDDRLALEMATCNKCKLLDPAPVGLMTTVNTAALAPRIDEPAPAAVEAPAAEPEVDEGKPDAGG